MSRGKDGQRGFAAIVAVVIIVLFALIGGYMLTTAGVQHMTVALSQLSDRAWFAAKGGVEWGVAKVRAGGACPGASTAFVLDGNDVTVTCTDTAVTEGGVTYTIFTLTATATPQGSSMGDPTYARRVVRAVVNDL